MPAPPQNMLRLPTGTGMAVLAEPWQWQQLGVTVGTRARIQADGIQREAG